MLLATRFAIRLDGVAKVLGPTSGFTKTTATIVKGLAKLLTALKERDSAKTVTLRRTKLPPVTPRTIRRTVAPPITIRFASTLLYTS